MIENAKLKAKSDQEEAEKKAEAVKKAEEDAQRQAQIKKDEAENSQASNGNMKDGVPPPPPPPPPPTTPLPSPTENQPLGDRTLTETVGDRKVTFIQPKQGNVFTTPMNKALMNELNQKIKAMRAKREQPKANSET